MVFNTVMEIREAITDVGKAKQLYLRWSTISLAMNAAASSALNPELAEDARQIAQLKEQAAALLHGLNDVQYNWRPASGCWSMAQCVAHIVVTDEIYIPG